MTAVQVGGAPLDDARTPAAHVPPSQVKVTFPQPSSLGRYVKVAEMDGTG